jgi:hypothetical protein
MAPTTAPNAAPLSPAAPGVGFVGMGATASPFAAGAGFLPPAPFPIASHSTGVAGGLHHQFYEQPPAAATAGGGDGVPAPLARYATHHQPAEQPGASRRDDLIDQLNWRRGCHGPAAATTASPASTTTTLTDTSGADDDDDCGGELDLNLSL